MKIFVSRGVIVLQLMLLPILKDLSIPTNLNNINAVLTFFDVSPIYYSSLSSLKQSLVNEEHH